MDGNVLKAREEIVKAGYIELKTKEQVDSELNKEGTTLVMVNSICGCAGVVARPAASLSLENDKKPDHLVTVFAGQDKEITDYVRTYFKGYEPSSPSFALLKNGEIITMVQRQEIKGHKLVEVVSKLKTYFNEYCG